MNERKCEERKREMMKGRGKRERKEEEGERKGKDRAGERSLSVANKEGQMG